MNIIVLFNEKGDIILLTELVKKISTKCSTQIKDLLMGFNNLDLSIYVFPVTLWILGLHYLIESSYIWQIQHIGINSRHFMNIKQTSHNLTIDFNYTDHFNTIEVLEQEVNRYAYTSNISLGIIILVFILFTVFTWIKFKNIKVPLDKDFEYSLISIIGTFFGICFGLSTGGYLLLCSSVTDYFNQLFYLSAIGIPYDKLPFESWNESAQTLYIDYMGFLIVSILTFLSLLTRIAFIKSSCKAWKNYSDGYILASIGLSITIFWVFFNLDRTY